MTLPLQKSGLLLRPASDVLVVEALCPLSAYASGLGCLVKWQAVGVDQFANHACDPQVVEVLCLTLRDGAITKRGLAVPATPSLMATHVVPVTAQ